MKSHFEMLILNVRLKYQSEMPLWDIGGCTDFLQRLDKHLAAEFLYLVSHECIAYPTGGSFLSPFLRKICTP